MQMQVDKPVLSATTKCEKGFFCLSGKADCTCRPAYASKYPFIEIKPTCIGPCSYLFRYGELTYCLCPTRNAIYQRYQV